MQEKNTKLISRKDLFYILGLIILIIWGAIASYIAYNKNSELEIALHKNNELTNKIDSIKFEVINLLTDTYTINEEHKDFNTGLGSFFDFDPDSNTVKDIRVEVIQARGISDSSFYVMDKVGRVVLVHADHLPSGIESAKIVVLRGHLNKDSFHAHEVLLD